MRFGPLQYLFHLLKVNLKFERLFRSALLGSIFRPRATVEVTVAYSLLVVTIVVDTDVDLRSCAPLYI